jgi:hypothetical protein
MARPLKHGDILQIPLPNNLGFAYGRYLDLEELFPPLEPPRLSDLIKVFNYKTPTKEPDKFQLQAHREEAAEDGTDISHQYLNVGPMTMIELG